MTWLRDAPALVAHLVQSHEHHARVNAWWPGRALAVCPFTELGFLRVACAPGSTMEDARTVPAEFLHDEAPAFIPCDRHTLDSPAITSPRKTTDIYLADLATARGWNLATLDGGSRTLPPTLFQNSWSGHERGRVHAPPHWLQAVPPLTAKLSFPAQKTALPSPQLGNEGETLDTSGSHRIAGGTIQWIVCKPRSITLDLEPECMSPERRANDRASRPIASTAGQILV